MRIKIENFAKIKYADILVDGITVIAGENNTGKSTIGKVLYSTFNSLYDIDNKIEQRRIEEIKEICRRAMRNAIMHSQRRIGSNVTLTMSEKVSEDFAESLLYTEATVLDRNLYVQLLDEVFARNRVLLTGEAANEYVEATYDKVMNRINFDDEKIALEVIERFWGQIFEDQIKPLNGLIEDTKIQLTIKDKTLQLCFKDNHCSNWIREYDILHEAFLLDDPFVLDEMSKIEYRFWIKNSVRFQLAQRLNNSDNNIMEGLFDAVSAKDNLRDIYEIVDSVISGNVGQNNGHWGLNDEGFEEPVFFENLSAGVKSFVELKMLLEKGILKDKDILILDEPEIHLHPEWQLIYAQLIVLLQKKFDLSIVVTTHSRDFLEAIELYSRKYEINQKCNYYLSKREGRTAIFENVTDSLDKIYAKLVSPSMLLDKLRYEMEEVGHE